MQMTLQHHSQSAQDLSSLRPRSLRGEKPPAAPGLAGRLARFMVFLGLAMFLIFGLLPVLTSSVPILDRMSRYLDDNGIDPTRYYYTDVEQVKEAEIYLRSVLDEDHGR